MHECTRVCVCVRVVWTQDLQVQESWSCPVTGLRSQICPALAVASLTGERRREGRRRRGENPHVRRSGARTRHRPPPRGPQAPPTPGRRDSEAGGSHGGVLMGKRPGLSRHGRTRGEGAACEPGAGSSPDTLVLGSPVPGTQRNKRLSFMPPGPWSWCRGSRAEGDRPRNPGLWPEPPG